MLNDSLFVSDAVVARQVKLADGSEHTLYFKEIPAIDFRKFYIAEQSDDEDIKATSMAKLIVASMCNQDGSPAITLKQALKLKGSAMNAIVGAVMDINGFGNEAKNA